MRRGAAVVLGAPLALAAVSAPAVARASPQDLFGYGPRAMAMGATGATFVDDFAAVHANPAGLARARERTLSAGVVGAGYALHVARGAGPEAAHGVERARALWLGVALPVPLDGLLRDRLTVGVGLHLPFDVIARNRVARPETPQFLVLEHRAQSIALQFAAGVALPGRVRVGAGVSANAALGATLQIANDANGVLAFRLDDRLTVAYAAVVGASWDVADFRLGAVYRHTLAGDIRVAIEARDLGITLPQFNISGVPQYDPRQVALEAGYARGPWTLAAGLTWKGWGEYPGPVEATTRNSPAPPPPGFRDTWVLRAGGEYRVTDGASFAAFRAGYFFEPTPAPEAVGVANYLDNDRHVATLGLGVGGRAEGTGFALDVFAQYHALAPRAATKRADVPADNPGSPAIRHGGAVFVLGLTLTVTL